ncbi:MAG: hypothetical protein KDB22_24365 [Planctomycetales bacterium]|nr:hypothetical protein [Planctomycetales bacterium]
MQLSIRRWKSGVGSKSRKKLVRRAIFEQLEIRKLLAFDVLSNSVELPAGNEYAALEYQPDTATDLFSSPDAQNLLASGDVPEPLLAFANQALWLRDQRMVPAGPIAAIQNSGPSVQELQSQLIGNKLGGVQFDWQQIADPEQLKTSEASTVSADDISRILSGQGLRELFGSQNIAALSTGNEILGMVCMTDGSHARSSSLMAEGELTDGGGDGSGDGSGDLDLNLPSLQFLAGGDTYDTFSPPNNVSSHDVTSFGSFDESSAINPDLNASGTNWVHIVDTNWTSPTLWSFSETFVLAFNISESGSESGDLSDLSSSGDTLGESTGEGGEGSGDGLVSSGGWSIDTAYGRGGFAIIRFTASLGVVTSAAAGVAWSLSVDYGDRISVSAVGSGASTFAVDPNLTNTGGDSSSGDEWGGSGDGNLGGGDSLFPDDFHGESAWNAGAGVVVYSTGDFSISSTPSVVAGGIQRNIVAGGSSDTGSSFTTMSDWASMSGSGDLAPIGCFTCNSLPSGGDFGFDYDSAADAMDAADPAADLPFNPIGGDDDFEGAGHASSASGGDNGGLGNSSSGSWNLQGIALNDQWQHITGGAAAGLEAINQARATERSGFIFRPFSSVTPLPHGEGVARGFVTSAWDGGGGATVNLDASANSTFSASPTGELIVSDAGTGDTEVTLDEDGNGWDTLYLYSHYTEREDWDIDNGPYATDLITSNGYSTGSATLTYSNWNHGSSLGGVLSEAAANANASGSNEWEGEGSDYLSYSSGGTSHDHSFRYVPGDGVIESESSGNNSLTLTFNNKYEESGNMTATLGSDGETITWSGAADQLRTQRVDYTSHENWHSNADNVDPNGSGGWSYGDIRDAEFYRVSTSHQYFNPSTGSIEGGQTFAGDDFVRITSVMHGNLPQADIPRTTLEQYLETIFTEADNGYPVPEEGGLPPDYEYPPNPNPGNGSFIKWFAESDAVDATINYAAGFADNVTLNASWYWRKQFGNDTVDYDGGAYSAGGWTATIIQAPALAKSALSAGRAGLAYANAVDDAGRCANWVSKVVRGGWYVGDVERHAAQRFSAKSTVGTGDWRKQVRA